MGLLVMGLTFALALGAQEQAPSPQRIANQEHWVTNNQLFSVLSLDYQVEPNQGWLIVTEGSNRFYIQSSELFPELRMMQAWANSVNISLEEINQLNTKLPNGRLFLTAENKVQLVLEHSYHGMKMTTEGLIRSVERFIAVRDQVVELIANL